ncbi:hypothetical protein JTE90_008904 [Oedothorax gibbosus]|uniref:Uncharacterized protein n=1 Tax=Oedothorax gibbosus TaxID=931172 RepID=A0AAV6UK39_9ARAC|nr:hypothetical protein JTE90_008904 [Oedothorax gibbosus]
MCVSLGIIGMPPGLISMLLCICSLSMSLTCKSLGSVRTSIPKSCERCTGAWYRCTVGVVSLYFMSVSFCFLGLPRRFFGLSSCLPSLPLGYQRL